MKFHQWELINEEYKGGEFKSEHKCSRCSLTVHTTTMMLQDEMIMRRDQDWTGDCDLSIIRQIHEL